MSLSRRLFLQVLALGLLLPAVMSAASLLPSPTGKVLLHVTGNIAVTNSEQGAAFDRAMLQDLDWVEVETYTAFTEGPQRFAGPTLTSVLAAVGVQGDILQATAINDYSVQIPVAHASAHDVLLAMDMNGRPMRVRDKGPIWVVYPMTQLEAEAHSFDGQMIWQLTQIRID
ncbi:MAG: molybdopterin-dependent oxidoreductase [Pseudomonadota bacterium]